MSSRTARLGTKITLVLLLAVQAIAARPVTRLAELDAVVCCEDHCERGETASQASRCCDVDPFAEQLTSASLLVAHPPSTSWLGPAPQPERIGSAVPLWAATPRARSSPVYLVTRSLLI